MAWLPTELLADPGRVDGIATVMTRAVLDRGDQGAVGSTAGAAFIEQSTDRLHHLLVGALAMAAHAVAAAELPLGGRQQQRIHVILHIQPVAHVGAIAV